jgi:hypothetical protein
MLISQHTCGGILQGGFTCALPVHLVFMGFLRYNKVILIDVSMLASIGYSKLFSASTLFTVRYPFKAGLFQVRD